jgi:hypothetical protein
MKTRSWIMTGLTMAVLAGVTPGQEVRERVAIGLTKKTDSSRAGSAQNAPRGTFRSKTKEMFYRVEVRAVTTDVPTNAIVGYVMIMETIRGDLVPASAGAEEVELVMGKTVIVDTDPAEFRSVSWTGNRPRAGGGSMKEDVYGCLVRVYDMDGNIVGSRCQPASLQSQADKLFKQAQDRDEWKNRIKEIRKKSGGPRLRRPGLFFPPPDRP